MAFTLREAREFLKNSFYFDVHGHKDKLLPRVLRVLSRRPIPRDVKPAELPATGVNGFILCALGDPNSFRKRKVDSYASVKKQLAKIKKSIKEADGVIALSPGDLTKAVAEHKPVFVLGIEGGDFIGSDIDRLYEVYQQGVRVLGLVHYSKNLIGSIGLGWGGKAIPQWEQTGLTAFGKEVVRKANEMGMIIDLAHGDEKTVMDAAALSKAPVICSHTGPRALQDFPRYLSDQALKAVAHSGGIVGLWLFYQHGTGIPDINTFSQYAGYLAELLGAEHLAIGSDINGVPGNMEGYENLPDAHKLIHALSGRGFSEHEIKGICGGNFLKLFKQIAEP